MGRPRKPFIDKTTNLFITLTNEEIITLLEKFNISYDIPDMIWPNETKELLIQKIKEKIL